MKQILPRLMVVAWLGGWLTCCCQAGEPSTPTTADYTRDIKPLFNRRCYSCHGAMKRSSGLRLDTVRLMLKGGDGGPAITPGKSDESLIVEAIGGHEGWRMPPEGEGSLLSAAEIAMVRSWIDAGAKGPPDERPQPHPRDHWSFQPPIRPALPVLSGESGDWALNPVDAFLAERHQQRGLTPLPTADPADLIRRVCLDLTGLLPTIAEVRAFCASPTDRAYEEIVDRLLASPQYGERWGRHWMDIWRYSDWDGFGAEIRESQPHVWRWRDWIVESLNADKGYDQMIVQMLAADEASPEDADALRATGFLARNWYKFNRNSWLDTTIEHTSKAFLGLTLNCARCHDHKYDPIAQTEYYQFRSFFEPHQVRTDRFPGQPDTQKVGLTRAYDAELATRTFLFRRGDEKRPVEDKPLVPAIPAVLGRRLPLETIHPVSLAPTTFYPALNRFVQEETLAEVRARLATRDTELSRAEEARKSAGDPARLAALTMARDLARLARDATNRELIAIEARIRADQARYASPPAADADGLARTAAKAEHLAEVRHAEENLLRAEIDLGHADAEAQRPEPKDLDARRKAAADARTKRDKARAELKTKQQALRNEARTYSPLGPVYPNKSSGRRLALAHWIANRGNPLTARVAINHIWMRHFGTSLVSSEFDFGVNGKPPTHPALLDWLAVELMDSGWKMKSIHRLLVTSRAYRMQSTPASHDRNLAIDPSNKDYWRMNTRRMEAEAVRDNLLRVAGNLDLSLSGPDLDPALGLTSTRRSLYFRHAKEKRVLLLRLFDSSNVLSCYRRPESIVPQQALALANSPLSLAQARRLAKQISASQSQIPEASLKSPQQAFISEAFERILGRPPRVEEEAECVRFLANQTERLANLSRLTPFAAGAGASVAPAADPAQRARESLVHVLFNHNDFVTIH